MLWQPFFRCCCLSFVVAFPAGIVLPTVVVHAEPQEFEPRVVIPRAMPAIREAPVISAEQVDLQLDDAELVLGVTVGGESRAYPINMLTGPQREIINDKLGGRAIAATW